MGFSRCFFCDERQEEELYYPNIQCDKCKTAQANGEWEGRFEVIFDIGERVRDEQDLVEYVITDIFTNEADQRVYECEAGDGTIEYFTAGSIEYIDEDREGDDWDLDEYVGTYSAWPHKDDKPVEVDPHVIGYDYINQDSALNQAFALKRKGKVTKSQLLELIIALTLEVEKIRP